MTESQWLNEPEARIWRGFVGAWAAVLQSVEAELKSESNLTLDDYEVLVHLSEAPTRRIRMSDLSQRVSNSRSRLTQRIDRMARRGLVTREKCTEDARGTWAVLTDDGFRAIEAAAPGHVAQVRVAMLDHIPEEHHAVLIEVLELLSNQHSVAPAAS